MPTRSCLFVSLALFVLLGGSPAAGQVWPDPIGIGVGTDCTGDAMRVRVSAYADEPGMRIVVRRTEVVPDLTGGLLLTPAPQVVPTLELVVYEFDDPGPGPGDIGFYEIDLLWSDGTLYDRREFQLSCTERPFLMRGHLVADDTYAPCTGQGLLECTSVDLFYSEDLQYVGTGELVELHGWVVTLQDREQCSVSVVDVVSLGTGVTCEDVVPNATISWGALKASYR